MKSTSSRRKTIGNRISQKTNTAMWSYNKKERNFEGDSLLSLFVRTSCITKIMLESEVSWMYLLICSANSSHKVQLSCTPLQIYFIAWQRFVKQGWQHIHVPRTFIIWEEDLFGINLWSCRTIWILLLLAPHGCIGW